MQLPCEHCESWLSKREKQLLTRQTKRLGDVGNPLGRKIFSTKTTSNTSSFVTAPTRLETRPSSTRPRCSDARGCRTQEAGVMDDVDSRGAGAGAAERNTTTIPAKGKTKLSLFVASCVSTLLHSHSLISSPPPYLSWDLLLPLLSSPWVLLAKRKRPIQLKVMASKLHPSEQLIRSKPIELSLTMEMKCQRPS